MTERRWTDADLRAAWEAGLNDGVRLESRRFFNVDHLWEKSKPRARIRALEIATAGLPEGGR